MAPAVFGLWLPLPPPPLLLTAAAPGALRSARLTSDPHTRGTTRQAESSRFERPPTIAGDQTLHRKRKPHFGARSATNHYYYEWGGVNLKEGTCSELRLSGYLVRNVLFAEWFMIKGRFKLTTSFDAAGLIQSWSPRDGVV